MDLLKLPPSGWAPIRAVWLASERTASEAWFDFREAFEQAEQPAVAFGRQLDRLRFQRGDPEIVPAEGDDPDARFWLLVNAAETTGRTVKQVFPAITPLPAGSQPNGIRFARTADTSEGSSIGAIDDPHLFDPLSSGERAWVDIAMAHAAADLEGLAATTLWLGLGLERLSDETLFETAVELEALAVFKEKYWRIRDVDIVLEHVRRLLGSYDLTLGDIVPNNDDTRDILAAPLSEAFPILREALRPTLLLHLYDEPERHLHPAAQRRVAQFLDEPRTTAIAVATHSHYFLGAGSWAHFHLGRTRHGPVVTAFDPAQLDSSSAISRDMGLSRGELFTRVQYVLLVEGPVDLIVLRALYGPDLDEAGILILPIHGVDEAAALAELYLLGRILEVPVGLLVDHLRTCRLDNIGRRDTLTKEERAIRDLRIQLRQRGRSVDFFGLEREDIIAYLDEAAVQAEMPAFPGWASILRRRHAGENLKTAAGRITGAPFGARVARLVSERMRQDSVSPSGDLDLRIREILRAAAG